MSHVVTIELEVRDLVALQKAAEDLGARLVLDQKTYRWFGKWMSDYNAENAAYLNGIKPEDYGKCDHVITHPDCNYDIGVVKQPNGRYRLVADEWYAGGLTKVFGEGLANLRQRYGVVVSTRVMRQQGFLVKEQKCQDGGIRLVCTK